MFLVLKLRVFQYLLYKAEVESLATASFVKLIKRDDRTEGGGDSIVLLV